MPRKKFKCSKCDRSFSMAAHLARHVNTIHATGKRKANQRHGKKMLRLGRPKGISSRFALGGMSLDELMNLIDAARVEARQRLSDVEAALG